MRKVFLSTFAASVAVSLTACTGMSSTVSSLANTYAKTGTLTNTEIIGGLKEALTSGVSTGVKILAAKDGYYNDLATRIGLPEEATIITQNIAKLPGGQTLVTNTIKRINAAATDAVVNATPIFVGAIKDMTISDAANILKGNKTAATTYFKGKTKSSLKNLFSGYIKTSIDKKLIGDISCSSSWNTLTSNWNSVATTVVGKAAGLKSVNTNLNDYLTDKAVDGLYYKIGEQEANIRTNASARTTALLKKVFGH